MSEFFIKKLDQQVTRNNDFMIIHDIKYKHELSISYTAFLNQREKAVSSGIRQDF